MSQRSCFKPQSNGFTLIEIMISMLIGVVLIAGVIQVFITSKQSYRMQEELSRLQESGRFALDFLDRDIRMAGFRGCASKSPKSINNRLAGSANYAFNFNRPIEGFEASSQSGWTPAHNTATTLISNPKPGSDIITIRRAGDDSVQILPGSVAGGSLLLSRNTVPGLRNCDVVMVSDCETAEVFQISTIEAGNLVNQGGCANTPASSPANSPAKPSEKAYVGGNLHKAITTSYYVKQTPNGQDALYRKVSNNNEDEELVEGVEQMQVYYGLDNDSDADSLANGYVPADQVNDWSKVVSVRVTLLLKTIEDNIASRQLKYNYDGNEVQATDRRIRRVFTTTIAIRNKLP
jgi:type IV pilus assembly protein PilW